MHRPSKKDDQGTGSKAVTSTTRKRQNIVTLDRIAYIDETLVQTSPRLSREDITESKRPYQKGTDIQAQRNKRRGLLKRVVMVEREMQPDGEPADKPFIVAGVGINLSSKKHGPDYSRYVALTGQLKTEDALADLKKIYFNMMMAAYMQNARAFVCPLLSSGYYAAPLDDQALKNETRKISKQAYEQAYQEFQVITKHMVICMEERDSVVRAKLLRQELQCDLSDIAIGVAGADNSGTGNLVDAKQSKHSIPQEESIRLTLGGAFEDEKQYEHIRLFADIHQLGLHPQNLSLDRHEVKTARATEKKQLRRTESQEQLTVGFFLEQQGQRDSRATGKSQTKRQAQPARDKDEDKTHQRRSTKAKEKPKRPTVLIGEIEEHIKELDKEKEAFFLGDRRKQKINVLEAAKQMLEDEGTLDDLNEVKLANPKWKNATGKSRVVALVERAVNYKNTEQQKTHRLGKK